MALLSVIALVIGGAVFRGVVLSSLWGWFVQPTFDVPGLGVVEAIGISLIVAFLTKNLSGQEEPKTARELYRRLMVALMGPFVALIFGFVLSLFA